LALRIFWRTNIEKSITVMWSPIAQYLNQYLAKTMQSPAGAHPELLNYSNNFNKCARELAMHMKKEELIVFPAIRKMTR